MPDERVSLNFFGIKISADDGAVCLRDDFEEEKKAVVGRRSSVKGAEDR